MTLEKMWIQTFTGNKHFVLEPERSQLRVRDVARALSMQCRYAGHSSDFYSVAEHCYHVSQIIEQRSACYKHAPWWRRLLGLVKLCPVCLTNVRWGFVHDWSEAFLGDVTRPLKHTEDMRGYRAVEKRTQRWVTDSLGLPPEEPAVVKAVDTEILGTETHQLKQPIHPDWAATTSTGLLPPAIPGLRLGWSWRKAERRFLRRFRELFHPAT